MTAQVLFIEQKHPFVISHIQYVESISSKGFSSKRTSDEVEMDFRLLLSYFTDIKESELNFGGGMVPSQRILSAPARTRTTAP